METEYEVTLTKKHCKGANWHCLFDCPLYRAIKQELKSFPLLRVYADIITTTKGSIYKYDSDKWSQEKMKDLLSNKIESITLKIFL